MLDNTVIIITLGSLTAAFVNAAFATGGIYIMLLTSVSVLPASLAIPLQIAFSASSLTARIVFFWQHIDWRIVRTFVPGCLFGVYLGTLAFASLPDATLLMWLGIVLLILIWMPEIKRQVPFKSLFFFIGIVHSYLGALFGVGGVLQPFVLRTNLQKLQITGTLAACMMALDIMKAAGYLSFGFNYVDFIPHIIGATVAGFVGTWLGKRVTHRVSEKLFRQVFRLLVSLIAFRLIYKGWTG